MKKLHALVLALVMSMSLVTISNAAFSDADKIDHTEAVDMMNALGVINGMPDGSFTPAGNVTRAEMAKMITIILLGDVDASAFVGTTTDLTDINGHWAEGFIKYCYSQGVIAGRGDGTFAPNANVTASEAAKMLLVAIGYDADIQQYVGADWKINVARDAQTKRFYADLKGLTADKTLTRDEAAQMIYNAIQADGVKVTKGWNSENNTITYRYEDAPSLLKSTFGAKELKGQLKDSKLQLTGDNKGTYTLTVDSTDVTKVAADYSALLGQNVTVMFYDKDKNGTYDADEAVFGVYSKYANVATELIAQSAFEKTADKKVKANGTTYSLADSVVLWTVPTNGTISVSTIDATAIATASSDDMLRLVDTDNNGKYDLVVKYEFDTAKVTFTDSKKVIAGATTYAYADYVIGKDVAKKDMVSISYDFAANKTALNKIEKLTGKVTAAKTNYVKVDGGEWVYVASGMSVDQSYDYYVLNGVVIDKTQTTAAVLTSLVFVTGTESGLSGTTARVYYTDGKTEIVKVDTSKTTYDVPEAGEFCVISETSNGYRFKKMTDANFTDVDAADAVFTDYTFVPGTANDVATASSKITTIGGNEIADNAVIFVLGDGTTKNAKVITGKELKTLDAHATTANKILTQSKGSYITTVNGLTKVSIAAVEWNDATDNTWTNWSISASAENYALVTGAPITVASSYKQYTIWNGSENLTVVDKTDNGVDKFDLIAYSSIDKDGYILDVAKKDMDNTAYTAGAGEYAAAALTGFETTKTGYNLTLNGSAVVTTDKDTIFWTVNTSADTADTIGLSKVEAAEAIVLADKVYGVSCQNVIVYTAASGAADVVIVDGSNRLALKAATQYAIGTVTAVTLKDAEGNALETGDEVKAGDLITVTIGAGKSTLSTTNALDVSLATPAVSSSKTVTAGNSYVYVVGMGAPTFIAA